MQHIFNCGCIQNGKTELVQAASVSLHGSHGQHIENVHLQPYKSNEHFFDVLYKEQYSKLLKKAEEFIEGSGGISDDVLVFIRSVNDYLLRTTSLCSQSDFL